MHAGRWGKVAMAGLLACLVCSDLASAQDASGRPSARDQAFSDAELHVLMDVQAALVEARALSAQLDEHGALQRLLMAERALREILHVPTAQLWLSEVWLQMGIIAAQRGDLELAHSLLSRALNLDVSRKVGAAEAAPKIVALIAELGRERDAAPRSRFGIQASPPEAQIWLDGRLRGRGAVDVDVPPGPHLLRVEARDHAPYAVLLEAWAGTRAPVTVTLSETPAAAERRLTQGPALVVAPAPKTERWQPPPAAPKAEKPRWWRRWPTWASAAVIVAASAVTLTLATRDEDTVTERKLRVDPGSTTP